MKSLNYFEFEPEKNPFQIIFADITHRCNMACANCYIPNRQIPDMDKEKFLDLLKRLPQKKTYIRLSGGEATLRPDLCEMIEQIHLAGHVPFLLTNGLKLADLDYVKDLRKSGLRNVHLSMSGVDNDEIYLKTDKMRCAKEKTQALYNCDSVGIRMHVGAILVKDLNEETPLKLLNLIKTLRRPAELRFRNIGKLGRYMKDESNSMNFDEMLTLVCASLDINVNAIRDFKTTPYQVRFPLNPSAPNRSIWIRVTDWRAEDGFLPDPNSKRRGRVTADFKIAPFFEHVKKNEFGY